MIVAVTGGKGGVGKSTVALNLGAELGGVVVDADLAMADLPRSHGPDLHDVLAGRADAIEAVSSVGDVLMLPCGRTLAGARACDVTEFADAIARVASEYDHVVIDCPAGMAADAGLPLVAADSYVLVTIPRPFALADAVRTKALARRLDAGLCRVVLNRVREDPPVETVERTLGAPVTTLPESTTIADAQRNGCPVATLAPESEAREQFSELGRAVYSCRS
ncbi:cell division inhibitor [Haladaptatus paucihalophilus DX253]|uniref:Cell division inhibitor n=1 Tax=Haladaptatus paucihalophilus DX253 TaxID=797209 RepID=E7QNU3_HALPU|nr:P-loop NTPase [Haladaptatus paucihalophilus]EFW93596.1 cell division inhibitor [Haladaptatus paucihalophilus DX253]SHL44928.1 septum site-determining protein MinD [Haladaptatus paucihalophilus DX253]